MLKKLSFWGAVVGGVFIVGNLLTAAKLIGEPTSIQLVNVTQWTTNIAWILFGAFLVAVHIFRDSWLPKLADVLDPSIENPVYSRRRDWAVAFVLVLVFIGSIEVWMLNISADTSSLINWQSIFDFVANLVFFYIVVQLLKGAKPYRMLLYTTLVYGIVMIAIYAIREEWLTIVVYMLFMSYFIASAILPATRRNLVIIQILLLPLYLVSTLALPSVDNRQFVELNKKEVFLEQQFSSNTGQISGIYQRLLTRERPNTVTMNELRIAIERRDKTIEDLREILATIEDEREKEYRTIAGVKASEITKYFLRQLDLNQEQTDVLKKLLDYVNKINVENMSSAQENEFLRLIQEVDDYNRKLDDLNFEIESTNLRN